MNPIFSKRFDHLFFKFHHCNDQDYDNFENDPRKMKKAFQREKSFSKILPRKKSVFYHTVHKNLSQR
ncbi:hypothetical protein LA733_3689 [Leptospira interrogans]|nr:hypothetical protein LA733_3689 [Leptospira interrogans]KWV22070.1 hypothetical protein LA702_3684 [Leptospira interrogans]